ncbi:uncharacterized protein [Amphiura filiformis]|uniref:uncharacterized protein n=1 Tax=Amphiura filiformis TaxID=82378 RepID=UPI003B20F352
MSNLLTTLEDVTDSLDEGFGVDVIYLDYSKAFDTVLTKGFLSKLRAYAFLQDRKQQVGVRKGLSEWADVLSGRICRAQYWDQSFSSLYVNDLPEVVSSKTKMFADDTKLYNRVQKNSSKGGDDIQEDLNHLKDWSESWLLRFNASKCKCMHMGINNNERSYVLGKKKS